ncbi:hypothetical protein BGZ49_006351, partial [Haplosporangium sp. Z 27]
MSQEADTVLTVEDDEEIPTTQTFDIAFSKSRAGSPDGEGTTIHESGPTQVFVYGDNGPVGVASFSDALDDAGSPPRREVVK